MLFCWKCGSPISIYPLPLSHSSIAFRRMSLILSILSKVDEGLIESDSVSILQLWCCITKFPSCVSHHLHGEDVNNVVVVSTEASVNSPLLHWQTWVALSKVTHTALSAQEEQLKWMCVCVCVCTRMCSTFLGPPTVLALKSQKHGQLPVAVGFKQANDGLFTWSME